MDTPVPAGAWHEVRLRAGDAWLYGDLGAPQAAVGLVLFAHGSGSGRHSARNREVALRLHTAGFATLLFDLLTVAEQQRDSSTREHRFDIALLTQRVELVTEWLVQQPAWRERPIGYYGASTGSAAVLIAAARLGHRIGAVVSRGGRPDLAGAAALAAVTAPTLLIVGGADPEVLAINEAALERLTCDKALHVIPAATHLFEERGAMASVAELAAQWFMQHLAARHEHA